MKPSEVRDRILEEHRKLRAHLDELQGLAERLKAGERGLSKSVARHCYELFDEFVAHLDLEDRILEPALRELDGWGPVRADNLLEHHREQREQIRELAQHESDAVAEANGAQIAELALQFVQNVHDDMDEEERDVVNRKLLHDDPTATDVEAG